MAARIVAPAVSINEEVRPANEMERINTREPASDVVRPAESKERTPVCPVCYGLDCYERPRYFAGQLLTEEELNSEQAYVLAKNRLHNRYLHGAGVVCGLQVVCHDECEGWVTVKPGYAIGPCGNDLVVCEEHDFDVIGEINKCRRVDRGRDDCDPIRVARSETCRDVEECWCLTIAYEEREARPISALHKTAVCSPSGKPEVSACEPTRIFEGYRLGLYRAGADECGTLQERMQDTLAASVVDCLEDIIRFLAKRVPAAALHTGAWLMFNKTASLSTFGGANAGGGNVAAVPFDSPELLYESCCYLRQAVVDLYLQNPLGVRCSAIKEIEQLPCPLPPAELDVGVAPVNASPASNVGLVQYVQQSQQSLYRIAGFLLQYLIDCACQKLLPPCPADPTDDRLVLACMTIKSNEITHICNLSCRKHAGAFPSVYYWLSLIPIIPAIRYALEKLCCELDLGESLREFASTMDPTWGIRRRLHANNFAWLTTRLNRLKSYRRLFSLASLAKILRPKQEAEGGVNMDLEIVGASLSDAESTLRENRIEPVWREVASADDVPTLSTLMAAPTAYAGDRVVIYRTADTVVGYGAYDSRADIAEKDEELRRMREDLSALREEVSTLKRGKAARTSGSGKS